MNLLPMLTSVGGSDTLYVDDVFSITTYTGNGVTRDIVTGLDLTTVTYGTTDQVAFTEPGTYLWECPAGVTSVCAVCVGGGSTGGGGGLGWKNNISVTPGTKYIVFVGISTTSAGAQAYFISAGTVCGNGGVNHVGGTYVGDGGGNGGGNGNGFSVGGAGGYTGNGGTYTWANATGASGSGGGGGSGVFMYAYNTDGGMYQGSGGGGVGLLGQGPNGVGGTGGGDFGGFYSQAAYSSGGGGGSNGSSGSGGYIADTAANTVALVGYAGTGGLYGGAGIGSGTKGAVRLIWGAGRSFPSTNTSDVTPIGRPLPKSGGLLWSKSRSTTGQHCLLNSAAGIGAYSYIDNTAAKTSGNFSAVNPNGFSLLATNPLNANAVTYVNWSFRKARQFFDSVAWVGNGQFSRILPHNLGMAAGVVIANNTDTTTSANIGAWKVAHRSAAGYLTLSNTDELKVNYAAGVLLDYTGFTFRNIVYGAGKFVALGYSTSDYYLKCFYSTDGLSWNYATLPNAPQYPNAGAIVYGDKFVILGGGGVGYTSTDGMTWAQQSYPNTGGTNPTALAYGGGMYVGLAGGSTVRSVYSYDGISWTDSASSFLAGLANSFRGIAYNNGVWVAVLQNTGAAARSTDGINWSSTTLPASASYFYVIASGGGMFVASGNNSGICYSSDGTNWTKITNTSSISGITYDEGKFYTYSPQANAILSSPDAINWTTIKVTPDLFNLISTAYTPCYRNGTLVIPSSGQNLSAFKVDELGPIVASTAATLTVGYDLNRSGVNYTAYMFAHNANSNGLIQCGSFTTDGSGNATVTLGWEPQYVLLKNTAAPTAWDIVDFARGMSLENDGPLQAQANGAETSTNWLKPTATGFDMVAYSTSATVLYMAVRRANKPPTLGTQVYNGIARTGTGAVATVSGIGFSPDSVMVCYRNGGNFPIVDRLRGSRYLSNSTYGAEVLDSAYFPSDLFTADSGTFKVTSSAEVNANAVPYINWFFKRAAGVFDVVCDTGTGSVTTVAHNLGVVPELVIRKGRVASSGYRTMWHSSFTASGGILMNSTAARITDTTLWNNTLPSASFFSVGTSTEINTAARTYVTWLFASKAGVSKVGSYVGGGNLIDYSQDFDNASWTKNLCSVTVNTSVAPDGTITADTLTNTSTGGDTFIANGASGDSDTLHSIYIKQGGADPAPRVCLRPITYGTNIEDDPIFFDMTTKTFEANSNLHSWGYEELANSWFRIYAVNLAGVSQTNVEFRVRPDNAGAAITGKTVLIWGAQVTMSTANILLDTSDFTSANWVKFGSGQGVGITVTANTGTAPNGTTTADQVVTSSAVLGVNLRQIFNAPAGRYIWSVWVRQTAGSPSTWTLDISDLAGGSSGPVVGTWQQLVVTQTTTAGSGYADLTLGVGTFEVWGARLTPVPTLEPYAMTTAATAKVIDCSFTTGARFVMIKRTDAVGKWQIWDTARGIVAGNDPYLSLTDATAEVTSDDSVDPHTSGFVVNQAASNINIAGATYIYLALA